MYNTISNTIFFFSLFSSLVKHFTCLKCCHLPYQYLDLLGVWFLLVQSFYSRCPLSSSCPTMFSRALESNVLNYLFFQLYNTHKSYICSTSSEHHHRRQTITSVISFVTIFSNCGSRLFPSLMSKLFHSSNTLKYSHIYQDM